MFSKSIHATVKYETPQTYNWNCERKAGSLNINKVLELDYDQDASGNMASWENCHETFPTWASVKKQRCFRSSLLGLISRWFLVWLPGISVESNICRISFGFSFLPRSFHTCALTLFCFSSLCVQPLSLSCFLTAAFTATTTFWWGVWLHSLGTAGAQKEAVKSVCCSTLRKGKTVESIFCISGSAEMSRDHEERTEDCL